MAPGSRMLFMGLFLGFCNVRTDSSVHYLRCFRVPHGLFRRRLVPPSNTLFISPRSSFFVGFLPYCNSNFSLNAFSAAFKSRRKFNMGLLFVGLWLTVGNLGMRTLDILLNVGMRNLLVCLMGSTIGLFYLRGCALRLRWR